MNTSAAKIPFSPDDYLAWEAEQPFKNEYLDGEVFAMSGASDGHNTLAGNLYLQLRNHTRGTPCRTFMADMKLRVEVSNAFFYPDVLVTCSPSDRERPLFKSDPLFIAEVLSPSTEGYDRGAKFAHTAASRPCGNTSSSTLNAPAPSCSGSMVVAIGFSIPLGAMKRSS